VSSTPDWLSVDDDPVVWTGRPRVRSVARVVPGALVPIAVAAVAVRFAPRTGAFGSGGLPGWLPVGFLALTVAWGVARVAWAVVRVRNVEYALTTRGLHRKSGVLSETTTRVGVDRVQSVTLSKGALGTVFDYGDVDVSTAGGSGVELSITDLDDPDELRRLLRDRVRAAGAGTGAGGTDGRSPANRGAGADVDPDALGRVVAEARRLRETAERLEAETR
jgi:membrane protein YdbS with pleckstrin-like domain